MIENISNSIQNNVGEHFELMGLNPTLSKLIIITGIIIGIGVVSLIAYYISRFVITRFAAKISSNGRSILMRAAYKHNLFHLIAYLVPLYIIYATLPILTVTVLPYIEATSWVLQRFVVLFTIILLTRIAFAFLNSFEERYRLLPVSKLYSIKSYVQVVKLLVALVTIVFIISILINKSPAYFLASLGAMTAVILLVFKDSILGFVASIQLAAYDIARIGDWIEIPGYSANGTVIDISLNTIKVQNFDNTIVTIPSHALLTQSVTNWRGMSESGGRRIKRHVSIDVKSIHFVDDELIQNLQKITLFNERLNEILEKKRQAGINPNESLTNIGMFRAYLELYISNNPHVNQNMTCMVRQLQPEGKGLPIELYLFSSDTAWVNYERIQADIFDHIFATLPEFRLTAFQYLSGSINK